METLYEQFKSRNDFVILAVSQDQKGLEVVKPYVEKNGYHFEILLDPDNQVSDSYSVSGVPGRRTVDPGDVGHALGAGGREAGRGRAAVR